MAVVVHSNVMIIFSLASAALHNGDAAECARLTEFAVDSLRDVMHATARNSDNTVENRHRK